jgi:hypothetical protein
MKLFTYRKACFKLRGVRCHGNLAAGETIGRNRRSAY